jgi:hypothetical protein
MSALQNEFAIARYEVEEVNEIKEVKERRP